MIWRILLALAVLLPTAAHAQQAVGPLELQNKLSELTRYSAAVRANIGAAAQADLAAETARAQTSEAAAMAAAATAQTKANAALALTGGTLTGALAAPQVNGVKYITGIATDCSADAQPTIQAAVNAAYLGTYRKIVLPDGCIGLSSTLVVDGPTSWSRAANRAIEISGAGVEVTTVKALAAMTALVDKGPHYTEGGGFHQFSIDGAGLVTYPLRIEQSAEMDIGYMLVKNAATGGAAMKVGQGSGDTDPLSGSAAVGTYAGQSTFHDLTVIGLQSSDYRVAAQMPNYALWAASTDIHYSNIIAYNAKVTPVFDDAFSGGNKWTMGHSYGFGPYTNAGLGSEAQANLVSWFPQYCVIAAGSLSKFGQFGCDGATVAGVDIRAYDVSFHDSNFGWQTDVHGTATTGTAYGIQISNGAGRFAIHDNSFVQVSSANAIKLNGTPGPGGHIWGNTGAALSWGDVYADNLQFNSGFATVNTPNGYAASFYVPSSAKRYLGFSASTGSGFPQIVATSTTANDNFDVQIVPGGTGSVDVLGPLTASGFSSSGGITSGGAITASGGLTGSGLNCSNVACNLSTTGGLVMSLYAPANATYRVSLNASTGTGHPQIAANSGNSNDVVAFEITTQNGGAVLLNGGVATRVVSPPSTSSSTCSVGDISTYQTTWLYICVSTNTWARIAQTTTWP